MSFDWDAWVKSNPRPQAAARVLRWLTENDPDEATWRARDQLVNLVCDVVEDCITHVEGSYGPDYEMREKFE